MPTRGAERQLDSEERALLIEQFANGYRQAAIFFTPGMPLRNSAQALITHYSRTEQAVCRRPGEIRLRGYRTQSFSNNVEEPAGRSYHLIKQEQCPPAFRSSQIDSFCINARHGTVQGAARSIVNLHVRRCAASRQHDADFRPCPGMGRFCASSAQTGANQTTDDIHLLPATQAQWWK